MAEKKRFEVCTTLIYNGYVEVYADNEEDAVNKVQEELYEKTYPSSIEGFDMGEVTADFAEEIKD